MDVAGALRLLGPPEQIAHGAAPTGSATSSALGCAVGIGRSKMIAKLASRAAKPRASRAGPRPGPGRRPRRARPTSSSSCTATTSRRCGAWARPRPSACTTWACARWASWPPCPPTPWCAGWARPAVPTWPRWPGARTPSPVTPDRPTKSIGHEETFSQDLVDPAELERHVLRMAESVATMLRGASSSARTVTVKVKFKDLSLQTRSHTLERPHHHRRRHRPGGRRAAGRHRPGRGHPAARRERVGSACEGGADQLSFDLGDGLDEGNESATAREQSWQDVTAAVDAIRTRFACSGRLGRHGDRGRGAGPGPARRAVGPDE